MTAPRTPANSLRQHQPRDLPELLHRVAGTQRGRTCIMATLSSTDVCSIWLATEHRRTERDKRTHLIARAELQRRGLLAEQPPAQAAQ
jgi:hypothetical protein